MPKLPNKLYALMSKTPHREGIVAEVLCVNRKAALAIFAEYYDFEEESVRELGGLSLPYVQEMKPGVVRFSDWD